MAETWEDLGWWKVFFGAIYLFIGLWLGVTALYVDNNLIGSILGILSGLHFAYATEPFWNYRRYNRG